MKPFGHDTSPARYGYNFGLLLGWLESMVEEEGETAGPRRMKYVERAEEAVQLLSDIYDALGDG